MYAGIEATMQKETIMTCTLVLSVYTEILGGFVNGKLREEGRSRENYEAFLKYLGDYYVQLNYELNKRGTNLYKEVRSKIIHEFQPRPGFAFTFEKEPTDKPGLEYPLLGGAPYSTIKDRTLNDPTPRFLIFRVKEYYRDFRAGVEKYQSAIEAELAKEAGPNQRPLCENFMNVITIRD